MGSDGIIVGENSPAPKPESLSSEKFAEGAGAPAPIQAIPGIGERHGGAMSQQRGESGAVSTPQKFVRLVGYRDPRARPSGGR